MYCTLPARIQQNRHDESQPLAREGARKIDAPAGLRRGKGPMKVAPGGEQFVASVAARTGSPPRGGDGDAAGIVPQKGRAEGDVLGPVEEVVGLLFVDHGLGEIGHGLAAPQAEFAAEAQARHRQAHREGQADLLRRRAQLGLLPFGRRRFPVRRESLCRLFLRRRAEIIQANIVPGDAGEQLAFIRPDRISRRAFPPGIGKARWTSTVEPRGD